MLTSSQLNCATCRLHDIAHDISLANEVRSLGTTSTHGILHVSGTPIKSRQDSFLNEASAKKLYPWQLGQIGRSLACTFNRVLGQGGYSRVYYGQVVVVNLAGVDLTSTASLLWRTAKPLVSRAVQLLAVSPLHHLLAVSRSYGKAALHLLSHAAQLWGLTQPCAIKVLQESSPNHGAYGSRSIEHEVLITLHVSHACASCPYVGKAFGFELATALTPCPIAASTPHNHGSCAPRAAARAALPRGAADQADPDTVLLVLEPYMADLDERLEQHLQHAGAACEFPCSMCADRRELCGSAGVCGPALDAYDAVQKMVGQVQVAKRTAELLRATCGAAAAARAAAEAAAGVGPSGGRKEVASLFDYVVRVRQRGMQLSVREILRIAVELTEALRAVHDDANVLHLDIKPQNVLLDSRLHVKLVDFGLSAAFKPERPFIILHQLGRGTRPYTAPELLSTESSGTVSPAADIYSLGCCLLMVCLNGRSTSPPGEAVEPGRLLKRSARNSSCLDPHVPTELNAAVKACLSHNPLERPSAAQLLETLKTAQSTVSPTAPPPSHTKPAAPPDTATPPERDTPTPAQPSRGSHPGTTCSPLPTPLDPPHLGSASTPRFPRCSAARRGPYSWADTLRPSAGSGGMRHSSTGISSASRRESIGASSCSSALQAAPEQRGGGLRSTALGCGSKLPYTTSVRMGLASFMTRASSSGWFSESSCASASFPSLQLACE